MSDIPGKDKTFEEIREFALKRLASIRDEFMVGGEEVPSDTTQALAAVRHVAEDCTKRAGLLAAKELEATMMGMSIIYQAFGAAPTLGLAIKRQNRRPPPGILVPDGHEERETTYLGFIIAAEMTDEQRTGLIDLVRNHVRQFQPGSVKDDEVVIEIDELTGKKANK